MRYVVYLLPVDVHTVFINNYKVFMILTLMCFSFCLAVEILNARQKKAEELKRLTDLASQMAEAQLSELRAEIKVSL